MLKICNHCNKFYDANSVCPCRKNVKRQYKHDSFYNSTAWKKTAHYIKTRDYNTDKLALYLASLQASECEGVVKVLRDYLTDAVGQIRKQEGYVLVHHIIPREDDRTKWYDFDNLITLNFHTHEFVHQLYNTENKYAVQELLRKAVKFNL